MARSSYPQQGLFPGDGPDCGPYTANEWRAWILTAQRAGGMINTGAAAPPGLPTTPLFPNVGVFYVCPDRLLVEEDPANTIKVGTGAWLCDGTFGYNDTQITGIVPAVGVRTDYVIVRQNYSGADFNTGPAGAALTVTDNTADVTIIDSANFTQDQDRATYWDIPLASYDIDGAGVITNLVDLREWVDAETKRSFILALVGHNVTDVSEIVPTSGTIVAPYIGPRLVFPDSKECYGLGRFCVPTDFISDMTSQAVITLVAGGGGNIYSDNRYQAGECTETQHTHSGGTGFAAVGLGAAYVYNCIQELSVANVGVLDIVQLIYYRDAVDALDTLGASAYLTGWIVEYFGWGRR